MAVLRLVAAAMLAFGCAAELPQEVDWIVVGGGASGCTAAAALVDGGEQVLVIERGPSDRDVPDTQSAKTWSKVVPEVAEVIRWTDGPWGAVAKVLGGGASVNDGYFFEETPEFVKDLLKLSDEDVSEYFKSSKYLSDTLLTPLAPTDYGNAFAQAAELAGHGKLDPADKGNIRYKDGAWVIRALYNMSEEKQTRHTPALLLHDRVSSGRLEIATGVQVLKVNFEQTRAVGVTAKEACSWPWKGYCKTKTVKAKKGVIMAAGAIFTPQLLQISGIGDAKLLSKLGAKKVVDRPEVGANFVDRLIWSVQIAAKRRPEHFVGYSVATNTEKGMFFESVGGIGVDKYLAIATLGLVPAKQRSAMLRPVMKGIVAVFGSIIDHMTNLVGFVQDTKSRGSIEAVSLDSTRPPSVTANYFSADGDIEKLVETLKELVKIAQQEPLAPWRTSKAFEMSKFNIPANRAIPDFLSCLFKAANEKFGFLTLPCMPNDDAKWENFLRKNILSNYHYFGTAAVGTVVEPGSFQVKGTQGLYVVDASVIPRTTRINPVGTVMTIGHFVGSKLAKKSATSQIHI